MIKAVTYARVSSREAQQRLAVLRTRMDQMYEDKLDGKIDEEFSTRKMSEWREHERILESQLAGLSVRATADRVLSVERIFELARALSVSYAERRGTRSVAEICAFELFHGWRKSLAYIQKAVRSNLRTRKN